MTLYSTAAYTNGFQKRMKDMYNDMYGAQSENRQEGAFGIAGLQLYHQASVKEVQSIIDRIELSKFTITDPVTLQQTKHDKFYFKESTTAAELFGHKVPEFAFTEEYANTLIDKVEKINDNAFGTTVGGPNNKIKSENYRSALPKKDLKGSTLVTVEDLFEKKPLRMSWDEARAYVSKNHGRYRIGRDSIDEYFDVYEGKEGFVRLLQEDPNHAFTVLAHLNKGNRDEINKLWKKEVPSHESKLKNVADASSIINTIGSIIHAAGSRKGNIKAKQRAALSALSILFPQVRRYAGAFLGAQNLSDIFGGSK